MSQFPHLFISTLLSVFPPFEVLLSEAFSRSELGRGQSQNVQEIHRSDVASGITEADLTSEFCISTTW